MPNITSDALWHLGSYWYPFYRHRILTFLESYVRESYLVLDAGCGAQGGYILSMPRNVRGVGLDIDRKNVEGCVKKSKGLRLQNHAFLVGDIDKLPFSKERFNLIVCCDVLEHVKNPEKAIKELAFSLKRGGVLLISTSNLFNPAMFIDIKFPRKVISVIHRKFGMSHYRRKFRFSPWSLTETLRKNGLEVEKFFMCGYPPIGRPWIYHYSKIKPSKIYYFWILFDKLTNFGFFKFLKENMFVAAKKYVSI